MNNLTLNIAKMTEIIIYDSHRKQPHLPLPLPGITRVDSLRIFGVTFTRRLSASEHIRRVIGDCLQSLVSCVRCVCFIITVWLKSACMLSSGQFLLLKYSTPVLHGVVSLRHLIVTTSTRSSAAANAVPSVNQTFRPLTNLWKILRIGCFNELCNNNGHTHPTLSPPTT